MTGIDLEARLRRYGAALDGGSTADAVLDRLPGPVAALPTHRRQAPVRVAVAVLAALLVVAVPIVLARRPPPPALAAGVVALQLGDVPEGVSLRALEGRPSFLVRDGRSITAFVVDVRHLAGEPLWWCPAEAFFVGPTHGELFDRQGRRLEGPGMGDLNRYAVRVDGRRLLIDTTDLMPGETKTGTSERPLSQSRLSGVRGPWDSGPGSFCEGAVRSETVGPADG